MKRLAGKVALVTGGASGLGKAIAQRLHQEEAHVVITDRQTELGQSVAREHGLIFLEQDVTDEAQWIEIIDTVERRLGALHILVNNAGILGPTTNCSPEDTPLADWRRIFAVNVEGVFLGCRAAIPAMRRAKGGSIINISSVGGILATPQATAYGASKAAVRQLTLSVAKYGAPEGIRCNSVHPHNVRTPLWEKGVAEMAKARGMPPETLMQQAMSGTPMGKPVPAEHVAATVAFLACDEACHITGEQLIIDGGLVHCGHGFERRQS